MGVVTGQASNTSVALMPALASFQAIGLEPKIGDSRCMAQGNIHESAMAGAAEIHQVNGIEHSWIHNRRDSFFFLTSFHHGDVGCAGPMTGFAGHTRDKVVGIESIVRGCSSRMTTEATMRFRGI